MRTIHPLATLLYQRFGPEWVALTEEQQALVLADFHDMLTEEYDIETSLKAPLGSWSPIEEDNAANGSQEYRRRIGGGNLLAYAKTQEAR